jgi:hypothetical protein
MSGRGYFIDLRVLNWQKQSTSRSALENIPDPSFWTSKVGYFDNLTTKKDQYNNKMATISTTQQPECNHSILRQTQVANLPPLYIAGRVSPYLTRQLQHAHVSLGQTHFQPRIVIQNVKKLQRELALGMSKERRQQVQDFVLSIRDPWKRATIELYLARYPGFLLGRDGRLDYGLSEGDEKIEGWITWKGWGSCGVM